MPNTHPIAADAKNIKQNLPIMYPIIQIKLCVVSDNAMIVLIGYIVKKNYALLNLTNHYHHCHLVQKFKLHRIVN